MTRYLPLSLFLFVVGCQTNQSQTVKDYIKNLEEKNKVLEQELQESKNKSEAVDAKKKTQSGAKDYFTTGSTEKEVVVVMGDPTSIFAAGPLKSFTYGRSTVEFENGRVTGYSNFDGNLKVKIK
jgi:Tfp pilus assembly protein PilP